jgi:hypothetical protein
MKKVDEIAELLKDGRITKKTARFLEGLGKRDRALLIELLRKIKFGVNKQKELLAWIDDISKRDEIKIQDIFHTIGLDAILTDTRINGPQKRDLVRQRIYSIRYPELSKFIQEIKKRMNALGLPKGVKLLADALLEDREFRLEIKFQTKAELDKIIERINNFTRKEEFINLCDYLERPFPNKK